jgi:hypothetical protein
MFATGGDALFMQPRLRTVHHWPEMCGAAACSFAVKLEVGALRGDGDHVGGRASYRRLLLVMVTVSPVFQGPPGWAGLRSG